MKIDRSNPNAYLSMQLLLLFININIFSPASFDGIDLHVAFLFRRSVVVARWLLLISWATCIPFHPHSQSSCVNHRMIYGHGLEMNLQGIPRATIKFILSHSLSQSVSQSLRTGGLRQCTILRWHSSIATSLAQIQSTLSVLAYRAMNLVEQMFVVLCGCGGVPVSSIIKLTRHGYVSRTFAINPQSKWCDRHQCHRIYWIEGGDECKNNFHFHWFGAIHPCLASTGQQKHHRHCHLPWKVLIRTISPIILKRNNSIPSPNGP